LAVTGSSTSEGWYVIDSSVKVTVGSQRSSPYERQIANIAASTSSAPSPPASSSSPMRRVRSRTRGTAGPASSCFCTGSGTGRSLTGMRSMVRIRSCQGASFGSRIAGNPSAGVKAAGDSFAEYVEGGANADPSGSAGASGVSPGGRANSDVVCWSSSVPGGCSTPGGGAKALCASSD
jgi:hypothetical protein